ncbi:MAG: hypothetical protein NTV34_06920 [Proteobacteria bacterium]|nr:hypothetical protein [Pseudomonadota bacterium]
MGVFSTKADSKGTKTTEGTSNRPVRIPSSDERESKNFSVFGELTGLFIPLTSIGVGVNGSYFLDASNLLEARYYYFASRESISLNHLTFHVNSFESSLLHFAGNSFFVRGGLQYKRLRGDWNEYDRSAYSLFFSNLGWVAGLGNRWQFRSLTIGADWIDVFVPTLISSKEVENRGDPNIASARSKIKQRSMDPEFSMRFVLGGSF